MLLGYCEEGADISVSVLGGELTVNYTKEKIFLSGGATRVYEGSFQY